MKYYLKKKSFCENNVSFKLRIHTKIELGLLDKIFFSVTDFFFFSLYAYYNIIMRLELGTSIPKPLGSKPSGYKTSTEIYDYIIYVFS